MKNEQVIAILLKILTIKDATINNKKKRFFSKIATLK